MIIDGEDYYDIELIESPLKAIRRFCLSCCGENAKEVKECSSRMCVLKPYRMGHNPFSKRGQNMTDEQKQALADRLQQAREAKNSPNYQ